VTAGSGRVFFVLVLVLVIVLVLVLDSPLSIKIQD